MDWEKKKKIVAISANSMMQSYKVIFYIIFHILVLFKMYL